MGEHLTDGPAHANSERKTHNPAGCFQQRRERGQRLQQRSLYAYLTHVLTANARGDPIPTLV